MDCKRCLDLGHQCKATHETETGDPSCVFCLDLIDCPVLQKDQQRSPRGPAPEMPHARIMANLAGSSTSSSFVNRVRSDRKQESGVTVKTPETDTTIAPRICAKPGCTTKLASKNRSGKCADHFHWKAHGERALAGKSHATEEAIGKHKAGDEVGTKGNAVGNGGNGHALEDTHETPARTNGSNGEAKIAPITRELAGEFVEERLDRLLLNLPAADKSRIMQSWLRGSI